MVFLAAEKENRQLGDLPQADFGRVRENISSWSVFIQPCNHRLLITEKVVDEYKAIKLANKCPRKDFLRLESFHWEKVYCVGMKL